MFSYRSLFHFNKKEAQKLFDNKVFCKPLFPFMFSSAPNDLDQAFGKVLIIISRKVANAVKRNLLRRRIKDIFFRNKFYNLKFSTAVICKPGAANFSYQLLEKTLIKFFSEMQKS